LDRDQGVHKGVDRGADSDTDREADTYQHLKTKSAVLWLKFLVQHTFF